MRSCQPHYLVSKVSIIGSWLMSCKIKVCRHTMLLPNGIQILERLVDGIPATRDKSSIALCRLLEHINRLVRLGSALLELDLQPLGRAVDIAADLFAGVDCCCEARCAVVNVGEEERGATADETAGDTCT